MVSRAGEVTEFRVQQLVKERMAAAGLVTTEPPIVAFGPNAANPHYEPMESRPVTLEREQVLLLDLWAGVRQDTVFADQTWMGFSGRTPGDQVAKVWAAVRDARDAVVARLRSDVAAGRKVGGRD